MNSSSMSENDETHNPLHIELRDWELGPNNTIFDNLKAAPSDKDLLWQWGLLVGLSVFALVAILIVFLAILQDRKCRKNSFNVYILFLMVPDILFTGLGIMTTSLNIANGSFYSWGHCHLQSYYSVFTVSASSWLNAILAWQLHAMLKASNQHRRFKAPTRQRAVKHGLLVFLWSAFVATWTLWQVDWWPIRTELYSGAFCLPMAYDNTSLAFLFLVFGPCCFVVPFLYICHVVIDILWKQLLPPKEKRKRLLIFFGLIITYFFIWVPTIVLTYILGYWMTSWYTYFGAVWGVSQGFISAAVCLLKADIQQACRKFVGCQHHGADDMRMSGASGGGQNHHRHHQNHHRHYRHASEAYIHTSNFGLDGNSMHSVAPSVIDLSSHREVSSSQHNGRYHSHPTTSTGSIGSTTLSESFQTVGSLNSKPPFPGRCSDDTILEVDEEKLMDEVGDNCYDNTDENGSIDSSSSFANESLEDEHDEHDKSSGHHNLSSSFRSVGMDGKVTPFAHAATHQEDEEEDEDVILEVDEDNLLLEDDKEEEDTTGNPTTNTGHAVVDTVAIMMEEGNRTATTDKTVVDEDNNVVQT
ncbi:unnamed protein product [Cylindrotheca closterium]|uniref:G-protein coupled receptors family 1 profile domain-containing protein n=1 Tax=Cylindrotheca closterium TaxID=2856 RepID=A0AAD2FNW9_9STRA|nr:unnamed protein product [Cylindrotheca closterium]